MAKFPQGLHIQGSFLKNSHVEIQIPHCETLLVKFKVGEDQSTPVKFPTEWVHVRDPA